MGRRCLLTMAAERAYPYHEGGALAGHRRRLLARAEGRVLDCSLRPTADLSCYRPTRIRSLDTLARLPAGRPGGWADVIAGPVVDGHGPLGRAVLPDGLYDTVVCALTLCTVDDLAGALADISRWLAPGGRLLVLEHVRGTGLTGMVQQAVRPLGRRLTPGCDVDLDLPAALRSAGMEMTDCARFTALVAGSLPTPCVAGVVRLPVLRRPPDQESPDPR